jgi:hypothetical protein
VGASRESLSPNHPRKIRKVLGNESDFDSSPINGYDKNPLSAFRNHDAGSSWLGETMIELPSSTTGSR